jgi:hypothetical protein
MKRPFLILGKNFAGFDIKNKKMETKKDLVIFKIFESSFAANMAKAKLEENGVEAFIEEENVMGLNPLGGTELKVSPENLKKAEEILST